MTDPAVEEAYARAGYGREIGFGRSPALLIVDFVMAYVDPSSPLYAGVEHVIEPARQLLAASRSAGIPVIHTSVVYGPGGADGGVFFRKAKPLGVFVGHTKLGRHVPELAPRAEELCITKQYPSAFFGTSLASTLTAGGVDTVIVSGLSTSGCVRATVVDAMSHGFIPIVVRDAVGDHPGPHEANLYDMQAKYADVVDTETVVDHLGGM